MTKVRGNIRNKKVGELKEEVVSELAASEEIEETEMEMEIGENEDASIEESGTEMEMELNIEDQEDISEMDKIVSEKIEEENKEKASKRGAGKKGDTEKPDKKEPKADLSSSRIMERELKKGKIMAPQGRIEKTDNGYKLLLAPELSLRTENLVFEEVGNVSKLEDGKYELTLIAANKFGDSFTHVEGEEEFKHDSVRVELHKPGRDKDVVERYTISQAKSKIETKSKKEQRKKEEEEKKAAREAEKAKEEENKDEKTA